MRAMILPYVDAVPSRAHLMRARAMVHHEARCSQSEEENACDGRFHCLQEQQRKNMVEYNAFRRDMHTLRQGIESSLASQNGSTPPPRKRPRSSERMGGDSEALRFEGMLTESLGLELLQHVWGGCSREHAEAIMALTALQNTQEALRDARRRVEEINAMRCLEQQQCAKVLAERAKLAGRRLEKIRALEALLGTGRGRYGTSLLSSLD